MISAILLYNIDIYCFKAFFLSLLIVSVIDSTFPDLDCLSLGISVELIFFYLDLLGVDVKLFFYYVILVSSFLKVLFLLDDKSLDSLVLDLHSVLDDLLGFNDFKSLNFDLYTSYTFEMTK